MIEFNPYISQRIARLVGDRVVSHQAVSGGYTPAARWRVWLKSGKSAFVKMGTTEYTAEVLRREVEAYTSIRQPFMPNYIGWENDQFNPMLVIEDLGDCDWPPPWSPDIVAGVLETLAKLHALHVPLKSFQDAHSISNGWHHVAQYPDKFLSLGLASATWLERVLPSIVAVGDQVKTEGEGVIHFDVRSGNLCRSPRGIVLVDWSWACLGNGDLDTGFWLPSLHLEGGPPPERVLPGRADIAAWVSGFFAARAGLPEIPSAPGVRQLQHRQLVSALEWLVHECDLPPPTVE